MKCTIKKKTDEVHKYIEDNRQIGNVLSRTNKFNRIIYTTYSELYNKYIDIIAVFDKTRVSFNETKQKLDETTELYENLVEIYNDKVSECERLKNNLEEGEIKEENKM